MRESIILEGHADTVSCLAVLFDGRSVSRSYDNTVRIWDFSTGDKIILEGVHTKEVACLPILSDDQFTSGSDDKTIRIWDLVMEDNIILENHTGWVRSLSVLSDG